MRTSWRLTWRATPFGAARRGRGWQHILAPTVRRLSAKESTPSRARSLCSTRAIRRCWARSRPLTPVWAPTTGSPATALWSGVSSGSNRAIRTRRSKCSRDCPMGSGWAPERWQRVGLTGLQIFGKDRFLKKALAK